MKEFDRWLIAMFLAVMLIMFAVEYQRYRQWKDYEVLISGLTEALEKDMKGSKLLIVPPEKKPTKGAKK